MPIVDERVTSGKCWADVFVDHSRFLVAVVIIVTVYLALHVPNLATDPSLQSMLITSSRIYYEYQNFVEIFTDDEFLLVAVKGQAGAEEPSSLQALECLTDEIGKFDEVVDVLSLSNLRLFQEKGGRFGIHRVLHKEKGAHQLPEPPQLQKMLDALPITDLLLSTDRKTLGVLVRIDNRWKFIPEATQRVAAQIEAAVKKCCASGTEYRIIGPAVIREAILRNSLKTALVFGVLCTVICTGFTVYIFRSLQVTLVTMMILGLSVLWVLGLMSLLKIPLNATTSISFGLVLITTLEIVIHMAVRFAQFRKFHSNKKETVRETVRFLARPCLISSATTAVGFGSCMVTSIPMVFQLGLIMSLGSCFSWALAMTLSSAALLVIKQVDVDRVKGIISEGSDGNPRKPHKEDFLSAVLMKVKAAISRRHVLFTGAGFAFIVLMFAGTPFIRTDPQLLRQLGEWSPEVKNIRFVESHLSGVHALQLLVTSEEGAFRRPEMWTRVKMLEEQLARIPDVVRTDSLLPFLEYMYDRTGGDASSGGGLLHHPEALSQIFVVTGISPDGKKMIQQHLSDDFSKLYIRVRIKNSPSTTIPETVEKVRSAAESVMKGTAAATVTGELVVVAEQGEDLIRSEIYSMLLAIGIITVLLMIQMGTPSFGLISLIPNIPPIAAVFGIMGWFGIPLDGVTIFAATVAVGLAVDNTVHFVNQLKREMKLHPELNVEQCVLRAYDFAAKPIASWSLVTFLGFLALVVTPFQAAINFGILVSVALLLGIFGDLIFMQSIILTFPGVRRLIKKLIDKEMAAQRIIN